MNNIEYTLQKEQEDRNEKFYKVSEMFREVGFDIVTSVNGISFVKSAQDISASFYIDDNLRYQGYITSDVDKHINYSVNGSITDVLKAADKFIGYFVSYTV